MAISRSAVRREMSVKVRDGEATGRAVILKLDPPRGLVMVSLKRCKTVYPIAADHLYRIAVMLTVRAEKDAKRAVKGSGRRQRVNRGIKL